MAKQLVGQVSVATTVVGVVDVVKKLALVIIILLAGVSIPSTGSVLEQPTTLSSDGTTLYVGGSGEGNYTKIQDAIDNASDGDTVFVYNGTYYEHLVINVSINLIGENKDITILYGKKTGHYGVVEVNADGISICGFNIQNSINGIGCSSNYTNISDNIFIDSGDSITCWGNNNIISGNNISLCEGTPIKFSGSDNIISGNYILSSADFELTPWWGEILAYSGCERTIIANNTLINVDGKYRSGVSLRREAKDNIIVGNVVSGYDDSGIELKSADNNTVLGNILLNNYWGISFSKCRKNIVSGNICLNNNVGIGLYTCWYSNISGNVMWNSNHYGIIISLSSMLNTIYHNNFINNKVYAHFCLMSLYNKWEGNYWDRPRLLPKPIIGSIGLIVPSWVNFDWHPAQEPYDI